MHARVGPHVHREPGRPIAESIEAAVQFAADNGFRAQAAALFVGGPRSLRLAADDPESLRGCAETLALVAHSAYAAVPWDGDRRAVEYVRSELAACAAAGIGALVTHLPNKPADEVAAALPALLDGAADSGPRLLLETPAHTPRHARYSTPEGLEGLFAAVDRRLGERAEGVGLCVDTAHLWTGGVDLRGRAAAEEWLSDLERRLPAAITAGLVLHLNDSARALGSGPDEHAALGAGRIWGGAPLAESGLAAFAEFADRRGLVAILERNGAGRAAGLASDYHRLRALLPGLSV